MELSASFNVFLKVLLLPVAIIEASRSLGPPPPFWRNDSANLAFTASINKYLSHVPFTNTHDGSITDVRPVRLDWDIVGDMPNAFKDGVACWMPPDLLFPEGEVLIAGGLWPIGIAHMGGHNRLNFSYSYDVSRQTWKPLPLPPFTAGRTQGACLQTSLIIISGGDGGTVGSRVMRLSKSLSDNKWTWDTDLPALPSNASRITGAAHSISDRWLVIGLGNNDGPAASKAGALVPYRLDLQKPHLQWEAIPAYPFVGATPTDPQEISVPISASVNGKWLVFGGQTQFAKGSAALEAWGEIPADLATMAVFGHRPTGSTIDIRNAYAYDPITNQWETLPKLPLNFVQGPKHAPVVGDRYVLLIGAQRRLSARRGQEPPGYLAQVGRPEIADIVQYYGEDVIFYDVVERVYGAIGKMPYGVVTASWVCNGTHTLGFGGEPTHGWNGNTESAIQMAKITVDRDPSSSMIG